MIKGVEWFSFAIFFWNFWEVDSIWKGIYLKIYEVLRIFCSLLVVNLEYML